MGVLVEERTNSLNFLRRHNYFSSFVILLYRKSQWFLSWALNLRKSKRGNTPHLEDLLTPFHLMSITFTPKITSYQDERIIGPPCKIKWTDAFYRPINKRLCGCGWAVVSVTCPVFKHVALKCVVGYCLGSRGVQFSMYYVLYSNANSHFSAFSIAIALRGPSMPPSSVVAEELFTKFFTIGATHFSSG